MHIKLSARHSDKLILDQIRTSLMHHSFFFHSKNLWNSCVSNDQSTSQLFLPQFKNYTLTKSLASLLERA